MYFYPSTNAEAEAIGSVQLKDQGHTVLLPYSSKHVVSPHRHCLIVSPVGTSSAGHEFAMASSPTEEKGIVVLQVNGGEGSSVCIVLLFGSSSFEKGTILDTPRGLKVQQYHSGITPLQGAAAVLHTAYCRKYLCTDRSALCVLWLRHSTVQQTGDFGAYCKCTVLGIPQYIL